VTLTTHRQHAFLVQSTRGKFSGNALFRRLCHMTAPARESCTLMMTDAMTKKQKPRAYHSFCTQKIMAMAVSWHAWNSSIRKLEFMHAREQKSKHHAEYAVGTVQRGGTYSHRLPCMPLPTSNTGTVSLHVHVEIYIHTYYLYIGIHALESMPLPRPCLPNEKTQKHQQPREKVCTMLVCIANTPSIMLAGCKIWVHNPVTYTGAA
jgi:hypothetical protein